MSGPRPTLPALSVPEASAIFVGIGIGIFKTPPIVAANVDSEFAFIGLWLIGGLLTLAGALCYAELGSARPHAGGEYHYLTEAYGHGIGFLFGWGRMTVMQTGAIAAVAFAYGDYAATSAAWIAGPDGPREITDFSPARAMRAGLLVAQVAARASLDDLGDHRVRRSAAVPRDDGWVQEPDRVLL